MIKRFINNISFLFRGKQGIKYVYRGKEKVYERPGGYFYLKFENK